MAAYSTVRALYSGYNGPLYQVRRVSDGGTTDVGLLAAGGYANATQQDTFCAHTNCVITEIYDQSPQHNDLTIEGPDAPAPPVMLGNVRRLQEVGVRVPIAGFGRTDLPGRAAPPSAGTYTAAIESGIAPPLPGSSRRALFGEQQVACPQCGSGDTELLSEFGSTSCKALWRCKSCREPFDYFKCH